jgi:hypothetical protein
MLKVAHEYVSMGVINVLIFESLMASGVGVKGCL